MSERQPEPKLPLGAKLLGCRHCRPREPGLYCASCPVSLRRSGEMPTAVIRYRESEACDE